MLKNRECVGVHFNSFTSVENVFSQDHQLDLLIVMGHASGLADKSNDFTSFLAVSQNFKYTCAYIYFILFIQKKQY